MWKNTNFLEILIHTNTTIHTNLNRMKNKNYSCFEYNAEERENLESIYSKSFPEQTVNFSGKDLQQNSSERILIIDFDQSKGVALGETPFGQTIIIDIKKEEKHMRKLGYPALSLIHIWRCRRYAVCRSRWSPYH